MKIKQWFLEYTPKLFTILKTGYSKKDFHKDLLSGITVGIVALPLAMAFAIGSGVGPERGLFTAIVAGFLISFLGGSRYQIGGPTGAFVVIVYDIVSRTGYEGLVCITLLAGLFLVGAALCKVGSWIKYVPYPLITGFTTGIALLIFSSQVKDLLGIRVAFVPVEFFAKWKVLLSSLPLIDPTTCLLGLGTLLLMIGIRKYFPKIPWGIAAVVLSTLFATSFHLSVETIQTRFGEIPRMLPSPHVPNLACLFSHFKDYMPDAITVAFLAGIESLLSAVVADGMTGGRHRANTELLGQGIANMASVVCGGIPATGAIARTATNIKTGGRTPFAGMIHAATLLLIMLFLAPFVSLIPLAALAAVLVMVAWNMSELSHFRHLFKAPKGDILILLATFFLTVFVDLTVAVGVGMSLAAFRFMKRMGDVAGVMKHHHQGEVPHPPDVEIYEVRGPLFFGVASSLKTILSNLEKPPKVFILRMRDLQLLDASGMHALEELYLDCQRSKTKLFLVEIPPHFMKKLKEFEMLEKIGKENIFPSLDKALNSL